MSKLIKVAVILAVAAVAIAAKQVSTPGPDTATRSAPPSHAVAPVEPLPELKIENLF